MSKNDNAKRKNINPVEATFNQIIPFAFKSLLISKEEAMRNNKNSKTKMLKCHKTAVSVAPTNNAPNNSLVQKLFTIGHV